MDTYTSGLNNNTMWYVLHPNYRSKLIGVVYRSREKRECLSLSGGGKKRQWSDIYGKHYQGWYKDGNYIINHLEQFLILYNNLLWLSEYFLNFFFLIFQFGMMKITCNNLSDCYRKPSRRTIRFSTIKRSRTHHRLCWCNLNLMNS